MANTARTQHLFDDFWPLATAATGVGYLAIAYAVARWLTRPSPAVLDQLEELPSCSIEAIECRTSDGLLLKGWAIEPPSPRATVALFHGLRGNRLSMLERVRVLTAAKYRCVAFDHRAHGASGGTYTSFGYHEGQDVVAVSQFLRARWPKQPSAALGCSMGAAAICAAGEGAAFDAFVLESLYYDLSRAFECRIGCDFPVWFGYFRAGIVWFIEHRLALRVADVAPAAYISRLAARPMLLVTGSEDCHSPPADVEAIASVVADSAQFAVIPGAGHVDLFEKGGASYQELLLSFLDQQLIPCQRSNAA